MHVVEFPGDFRDPRLTPLSTERIKVLLLKVQPICPHERLRGHGLSKSGFIASASPGTKSRWVQGIFSQRRGGRGERGEGLGWFGIRLYCVGFTGYKIQMGTGDVLAEARRKGWINLVSEFIASTLSKSYSRQNPQKTRSATNCSPSGNRTTSSPFHRVLRVPCASARSNIDPAWRRCTPGHKCQACCQWDHSPCCITHSNTKVPVNLTQ